MYRSFPFLPRCGRVHVWGSSLAYFFYNVYYAIIRIRSRNPYQTSPHPELKWCAPGAGRDKVTPPPFPEYLHSLPRGLARLFRSPILAYAGISSVKLYSPNIQIFKSCRNVPSEPNTTFELLLCHPVLICATWMAMGKGELTYNCVSYFWSREQFWLASVVRKDLYNPHTNFWSFEREDKS